MCCGRDTKARGLQKLWLCMRDADEFRRHFSWFQIANNSGLGCHQHRIHTGKAKRELCVVFQASSAMQAQVG